MTLREELDHWRAEEARLAVARKAAWEKDPGNLNIGHNFYGPMGYHTAFKAWAVARDRVKELEAALTKAEAA
jgi:hypothetical protein